MAKQNISEVGIKSDQGLHCPKCNGTNFKPKVSSSDKLKGRLFLPSKWSLVKCVTCGTTFKRG